MRLLRLPSIPTALFALTMTLVSIGVVMTYSAAGSTSAAFGVLTKQLIFAFLGLGALVFCYAVDYRHFRRWSPWLMIVGFALCLLVFVPGVGREFKGAHRWIGIGPMTIQPSEFAKFFLVLFMARMLADRRQYLKSLFSGLVPACLLTGLFACAIVLEPDFGAMFVLCVVVYGMWIAAGMNYFYLFGLIFVFLPAGVMAFLLEPYRMKRLVAFMYRDKETMMGAGYQLYQSLIAVGSGGLHGLGLGESKQKFHYLTEAHTDFIFAIMGEELGFYKMLVIVGLFCALTMMGWRVAWKSTDLFGSLLATGITLMIFVNAAIHMAVVLGLMPTKGLVLPFISAGGSSLIVSMAAVGLLMNVARNQFEHEHYGELDGEAEIRRPTRPLRELRG